MSAESSFGKLTRAQRHDLLRDQPREKLAEAMKQTPAEELLDGGARVLQELASYSAKLVKEERIDGELRPAQTLQLLIREHPFAARIEFVAGPAKGRKVLYDHDQRPKELRVKEAGFLGFAGGVWLGLDNQLVRRDTNHPVTDLGLGALIRLMQRDVEAARPFGGLLRKDLGFDAKGRYCTEYTAPAGAQGLYAQKTRVCTDPETLLPLEVEVHDARGLLERHRWSDVEPTRVDKDTFSLKAAGL